MILKGDSEMAIFDQRGIKAEMDEKARKKQEDAEQAERTKRREMDRIISFLPKAIEEYVDFLKANPSVPLQEMRFIKGKKLFSGKNIIEVKMGWQLFYAVGQIYWHITEEGEVASYDYQAVGGFSEIRIQAELAEALFTCVEWFEAVEPEDILKSNNFWGFEASDVEHGVDTIDRLITIFEFSMKGRPIDFNSLSAVTSRVAASRIFDEESRRRYEEKFPVSAARRREFESRLRDDETER
jgi:hypothetical protein